MDKLKKFLDNIVVTIFLCLMEVACMLSFLTKGIHNKDAAQIAVTILMMICTVLLIIKFFKKEDK